MKQFPLRIRSRYIHLTKKYNNDTFDQWIKRLTDVAHLVVMTSFYYFARVQLLGQFWVDDNSGHGQLLLELDIFPVTFDLLFSCYEFKEHKAF